MIKKYLYTLLFIACGLSSCDVLDTEPLDSYNEPLVWSDQGLAENVLKEAYWSILKDIYCAERGLLVHPQGHLLRG